MGAQSEANAMIGHPKPDKVDHDAQKAPTWCANRRCLETRGLNRAMSEFVSARQGPDGVQSAHKGVYWFGQERLYV
jgi:hypothetical protein